jgi:hypothetical protein
MTLYLLATLLGCLIADILDNGLACYRLILKKWI